MDFFYLKFVIDYDEREFTTKYIIVFSKVKWKRQKSSDFLKFCVIWFLNMKVNHSIPLTLLMI